MGKLRLCEGKWLTQGYTTSYRQKQNQVFNIFNQRSTDQFFFSLPNKSYWPQLDTAIMWKFCLGTHLSWDRKIAPTRSLTPADPHSLSQAALSHPALQSLFLSFKMGAERGKRLTNPIWRRFQKLLVLPPATWTTYANFRFVQWFQSNKCETMKRE